MLVASAIFIFQNTLDLDKGAGAKGAGDLSPTAISSEAPAPRITWFTSWDQAVREAQRSNRPILLQSAAPVCSGVPGMW